MKLTKELGLPGTRSEWAKKFDRDLGAMERQAAAKHEATTITASASDSKKARTEEFEEELTLHTALQECEYGYVAEIDLQLTSNRQMKKFLRSPSAYLVGKMRDCEVRWEQLSPAHKQLFTKQDNGRIMKCRWVLTYENPYLKKNAMKHAKSWPPSRRLPLMPRLP